MNESLYFLVLRSLKSDYASCHLIRVLVAVRSGDRGCSLNCSQSSRNCCNMDRYHPKKSDPLQPPKEYNSMLFFAPMILLYAIIVIHKPTPHLKPRDKIIKKSRYRAKHGKDEMCCVCLDPFSDGDYVRSLPCLHVHHAPCIDRWLTTYSLQCPLCNQDVCSLEERLVLQT